MRKEHDFANYKTQDEWDRAVFKAATHFIVLDFNTPAGAPAQRVEVPTFKLAVEIARASGRALVYAVTGAGRSTCLPQDTWAELLGEAQPAKPKSKPVCGICNRPGGKLFTIKGRAAHPSCWRTEQLQKR